MGMLISGTTPTITFTFDEIDVSEITVAYLVIKSRGKTVIEKDLTEAAVEDKAISWTLAQADTLLLKPSATCTVCCDWKTTDGTRGRSAVEEYKVEASGKSCEI